MAGSCQPPFHNGGNAAAYVLDGTDIGWTIRVTVAVHDANNNGVGAATTPETAVVEAGASASGPIMLTPPAVLGDPKVGAFIRFSDGVWGGTPPIFVLTRSIYLCYPDHTGCGLSQGTAPPDASLNPSIDDVGAIVSYNLVVTNNLGTAYPTAVSAPIRAERDAYSGGFRIEGSSTVGGTLALPAGTWDSPGMLMPLGPTVNYHWLRCATSAATGCVDVPSGSPTDSHKLRPEDAGGYIVLVASFTNRWGRFDLTTPAVGPIQPLSTTNPSPAPSTPAPPASPPTPTPTPAPAPSPGPANPPTGPAPPASPPPAASGAAEPTFRLLQRTSITGRAVPGRTIHAIAARWSMPARLTYSWELCRRSQCAPITGARTSTLLIRAGWVGRGVRAVVTGTVAGIFVTSTSAQMPISARR